MTVAKYWVVCFIVAAVSLAPLSLFAAEDTALHGHMEVIEKAYKALRKSLKDPAMNKESLETIGKLQAAAIASKAEAPAMAANVPEAEREKFIAAYRKDMALFIAEACQLEIAVLDGQNEKAEELLKALHEKEEAGHEKYTEE